MARPRRQAGLALPVGPAILALLLLPRAAAAAGAPAPTAAEGLNANGLPLLTPTNASNDATQWLYEVPQDPAGLLVMLHRCGRNAEDFWPPSQGCPQCIGMPEGVSISKQGLARGYALLAINSFNRSVGSGGKCWSMRDDGSAVRTVVDEFRAANDLLDLPLFFSGCSSGGSLSLRLPEQMSIDGIMPVAIGLEPEAFPPARAAAGLVPLPFGYPPVAYIHFEGDASTDAQIEAMLAVSRTESLPAVEVKVPRMPVDPLFFSRRDDMIPEELSRQLHRLLKDMGMLDATDHVKVDWTREVSPGELRDAIEALGDAYIAAANGSALNGTASNVTAVSPYLTPDLLYQQVMEEIGVADAQHTNFGDSTTAVLVWLEGCGLGNFTQLAEEYSVTEPAALSPVRAVPASEVDAAWDACRPSAKAPPAAPPPPPRPPRAPAPAGAPAPSAVSAGGRAAGGVAAAIAAALAALLLLLH